MDIVLSIKEIQQLLLHGGVLVYASIFALVLSSTLIAFYVIREIRKVRYKFLTVGSHKLRTPLSKIGVAVAEILEAKEGADARGEKLVIKDYEKGLLHQIAIEQQRLVGLVNLLLEVSEREAGRARYIKKRFDMVLLIREILQGYQTSRWRNDRVFIDFESGENELLVCADRRRIASVLQVLLENSIIYSPSGGRIVVVLKQRKRSAIVSVLDQGIGVSKGERRHIFRKFYRGDRAFRVDTEGTGVGLFLAKHIVAGHGGKIWFESDGEGRGSVFHFSIPRAT